MKDERPAFARGWPDDPELERLLAAFDRGDYATVRRDAPTLAASAASPEVKAAARDLRARIDPDPVAAALVVIAVVLLALVGGHYLGQDHEPAPNATPPKAQPSSP